jgi:chromosomal replication initiation ATPase DnaA
MTTTITGYMIANTGQFIEERFTVNGNFGEVRKELAYKYASEIYFRIEEAPESFDQRIINIVCAEYETWPEKIFVPDRHRDLVEPRQVIHYLLNKYTKLTISKIGGLTNKDHATVLHSNKVINNLKATDIEFRSKLSIIEQTINKFKN